MLNDAQHIAARAQAMTAVLSARMKAALTWEALNQFGLGAVDEEALEQTLTNLSDKEIAKLATIAVSGAYGLGRRHEATQHEDKIKRVLRQALVDDNTCDDCRELDGMEWDYTDSEWQAFDPPDDGHCEGKDRCRCILVFVGEEA